MHGITGKLGKMRAFFFGNALQAAAIKLYRVKLALPVIIFIGGEIDRVRGVVDGDEIVNFVATARELPFQCGLRVQRMRRVEAVEIKMSITVAPASPEEFISRFEHMKIVVHLDPVLAAFAEHELRFAGLGLHKIKIDFVLRAVEHLDIEQAVAHPSEAGNINILPSTYPGRRYQLLWDFFSRQLDPFHPASRSAHDANAHRRV